MSKVADILNSNENQQGCVIFFDPDSFLLQLYCCKSFLFRRIIILVIFWTIGALVLINTCPVTNHGFPFVVIFSPPPYFNLTNNRKFCRFDVFCFFRNFTHSVSSIFLKNYNQFQHAKKAWFTAFVQHAK